MGPDAMIFVFWMLSFKPAFPLSSFTFIKRLFSSTLLSAIRVVSFAYLRLLIFLPAILIPTCVSSSIAFCMMQSVLKLNKQGDNTRRLTCHLIPNPQQALCNVPKPSDFEDRISKSPVQCVVGPASSSQYLSSLSSAGYRIPDFESVSGFSESIHFLDFHRCPVAYDWKCWVWLLVVPFRRGTVPLFTGTRNVDVLAWPRVPS